MSEESTEQLIQEKGLNAPRLRPADIDAVIKEAKFHRLTDVLTICVLTLANGYTVTGKSACASPENYNEEVGNKVAYEDAREQVWPLEGYLLKQRLFEKFQAAAAAAPPADEAAGQPAPEPEAAG